MALWYWALVLLRLSISARTSYRAMREISDLSTDAMFVMGAHSALRRSTQGGCLGWEERRRLNANSRGRVAQPHVAAFKDMQAVRAWLRTKSCLVERKAGLRPLDPPQH